MHYAKPDSLDPSADDATTESCDRSSRVKLCDLGFHVPEHIIPDIIPISDPKLLFSNYHAQRDRRLRQLIRRYTNQIQYGCRNLNCNTLTCLSYRKRNSTAPLRRHTDLSARTLACQLVDDYARAGKDPVVGLCQNEPVVPWYENPAAIKKTRNSLEKSVQSHHNRLHENGPPVHGSTSSQATKDPPRHAPLAEHPVRKNSHDGVILAGRMLRSLDYKRQQPTVQATGDVVGILNSTLNRDRHSSKSNELPPPAAPPPAEKKDMASFTQSLFDLMPLRLLNWFPTTENSVKPDPPETNVIEKVQPAQARNRSPNPDAGDRKQGLPLSSDQLLDNSSEKRQPQPSNPPDATRFTLRTLTWDSAVWLRAAERVLPIKDPETYESNFVPFLKQSLNYCMSDPERLVATARDFQGSYAHTTPPPNKTNSDRLAEERGPEDQHGYSTHSVPKPTLQSLALRMWPSVLTQTKYDLEGLLTSLTFLESFEQRDLILNSIFEALQHSYILPSWLLKSRPGNRSRSTNGNGEQLIKSRGNLNHDFQDLFSNNGNKGAISTTESRAGVPLKDFQVSEVCLVALLSLAAIIFDGGNLQYWAHGLTFARFRTLRNSGLAHSHWPPFTDPNEPEDNKRALRFVGIMIQAIDVCEDWSVLRLLNGIMDVISHRLAVAKWASTLKSSKSIKENKKTIVDLLINRFDRNSLKLHDEDALNPSWIGTAVVELARTVMLKTWDRKPVVQRAGPVGGALELLAGIYRERKMLHLDSELFTMPFIADTFDDISMPSEWLSFRADNRQIHLLSFSFLFEAATLVRYFRAINIEIMRKSHENAALVFNDARHFMWIPMIPVYGAKEVLARLRPHMAKYFILTVRRDDILNDAINQIWRREPQELMRPLRVRLGKDEGEDGLDHGGVQQEFFRVVFAEALKPDYGMFAIDSTTRMTWFQPGSFEPLYRFEALGILMSLAVYNGLTLPVTFPIAFYRKLLDLKVKKLEHIVDGWPDLSRGLQTLLDWTEGDVGDVIARTYEFSYELCGSTVTVDIYKVGRDDPWPPRMPKSSRKGKERAKSTSFDLPLEPAELTPPIQPSPDLQPALTPSLLFPALSRTSSISLKGVTTPISMSDSDILLESSTTEAPLVTNENRVQYVKDYILWLTHKSISEQYEAFARGFYTCLDRTALSIFTPEALKFVIEGHPEIEIDELERVTTYDDYTRESQTIIDFWQVVRNMSPDQHRQLLEFVTASDRVPVNGMSSVVFIVQKNGDEDTRLPSSSTCYGRLLLPQYSSREILKEKLSKAIENCIGFGTL
ncbi:uncharacterized protein A1O9_04425 [Exophiala aquamarina CBS 119918]|uniref:HECT-type E3 ubiquitin transferase n=1 Tax=Exophiala aquamarina CBS 119918 TaxID=1182545 RepID=A0A072PVH7_9EURO|nr:uncharacterized protein A1O9_04425 [Exophiala aquamarina CBS 119918]KEF59580.1 hypothetical protein A1O9_04425 [Exophiala aquamarina CBS 119918]